MNTHKLYYLNFIILCLVFSLGINLVGAVGTYPAVDPSMILYYHFNNDSTVGENYPLTGIYDYSSLKKNATLVNNPLYNPTGGYLGDGAFELAGGTTNQYINAGNINFSTKDFSFSFWMKPGQGMANNYILGNGEGGAYCRTEGSNLECFITNSTAKIPTTMTCSIILDKWTHITASYDRSKNLVVYRDGYICTSANISLYDGVDLNNSYDFVLGIWRDKSFGEWNGSLDDVIIYNSSLSAKEIESLYYNYINYLPKINFTNPTPNTGISTINKTLIINTTINASELNTITFKINNESYNLLDTGIQLYLNFDNNSNIGDNLTNAFDLSSNNYHATFKNGNNSYVTGYFGNAAYFNSTTDGTSFSYANTHAISNAGNTPFTICTRFKYDSDMVINATSIPGPITTPFGSVGGSSTGSIYANTGFGFRFNFQNSSGSNFPADTPGRTYANIWYNLCGVYNGTYITIYQNGVQGTNIATTGNTSSGASLLQITTGKFKGAIDYLKIWNRSLTQDEVIQEYSTYIYKQNDYQYVAYIEKDLTDGSYNYNMSVNDRGNNFNITETRSINITTDNYYLTTSNGNINITYRISPQFYSYGNLGATERGTSIFNGIYANVSFGGTNYLFRPSKGGLSLNLSNSTYTHEASASTLTPSWTVESNTSSKVVVLYNFSDDNGDSSSFRVTYRLSNISLEVDVEGQDQKGYGIYWDNTGGDEYLDMPVPTFNYNGYTHNIFMKDKLFFSIAPDLKVSMSNSNNIDSDPPVPTTSNSTSYTSGMIYYPKLDGSRNPINETFQFVVSNDIKDIFEYVTAFEAYQVAPYKDTWDNSTIIASINYPKFSYVYTNYAKDWNNYGFRNIVFWYRSGYSEAHPTYVPLATSYGGNTGFNATNQNLSLYGYSGILYVDYWDQYTGSTLYYNASETVINRTGGWQFAWYGPPQSYAATMPYQYWMILQQEPVIKSLGVKGSYYDVFSGVTPWRFVDYNQSRVNRYPQYDKFNGSMHFNYLWSVNHSITMHNIHQYPIMSETSIIPYLGLVDDVYGQLSGQATYIPDFEIYGIQPYTSTSSYLWGETKYPGTPTFTTLRNHVIDNILFNRRGDIYKDDANSWSQKDRIDYYYILNAVQREQQAHNVATINYYNGTNWVILSTLLQQDDLNWTMTYRPFVRKTYIGSNLTDYVNKGNTTINVSYKGVDYPIYPNRSIVWNTNTRLFEYIGQISGVNVSIVESRDYYYLDADAPFNWTFINGINDTYLVTKFDFVNRKRTNYSVVNNLSRFELNNNTFVLYRLGNSHSYTLSENDAIGYTRIYDNKSEEISNTVPIWFSSSSSTKKHIESNLKDSVNVDTIVSGIDCDKIYSIKDTPKGGTTQVYTGNQAQSICSQLTSSGYELQINSGSDGNILEFTYGCSSSGFERIGYQLILLAGALLIIGTILALMFNRGILQEMTVGQLILLFIAITVGIALLMASADNIAGVCRV